MVTPAKLTRRFLISLKLRKVQRTVLKAQAEIMRKSTAVKIYNERLQPKRDELNVRVKSLYKKINSERLMELYLIYFSAIGAKMTEFAHDWLVEWGKGFAKHNFNEIGQHLIDHAKDEVGHDQWHRNDVRFLVSHYNAKYGTQMKVEEILAQGETGSVKSYHAAFHASISANAEFISLGMLYETELMTFTLAPQFIGHCVQELGFEIMKGLSFLRGHIVSDIDHVRENADHLDEILTKRSDSQTMTDVVKFGERTIDVYIEYFENVMELAVAQLRSQQQRHDHSISA